jgi:RES domain-containing protein
VIAWRIARKAHAPFDGEGARLYGSRWTPRGLRAVFTSATLSLAALERFVHTDPDLEPTDLVSIEVEIKPIIAVDSIAVSDLPHTWREHPAPAALASIGERWLRAARTVALSVPSVVIPRERNVILNPAHADFANLTLGAPEPFSFDPRMWKTTR